MKQLLKALTLVLVLVLAIGVLVACAENTPDPTPNPNPDNGGTPDGGTPDGGDENTDAEFTVLFKYIDPAGNPMPDAGEYTEKDHSGIEYGKNARNTNLDSVTAFDDYVIIGWNPNKEAAMAGTVDPNCTTNIKADVTVYSVVRAKENKTVIFLNSVGEEVDRAEIREGDPIGDAVEQPVEMGLYFREWKLLSKQEADKRDSGVDCIFGDCTFQSVMGATDGIIGKVAAGAISVDGKRDDLYNTKGAYIAHNTYMTADGSFMENETTSSGKPGSYVVPNVKVDSYAVWDGEYVYLLVEVWDKDLTRRSDAYLKTGLDAWCNDAVELWYTFEQDSTITSNETRVGFGSTGDNAAAEVSAKFALGRDKGIFGGRSTHYDDIVIAVRNTAIGDTGSDLDSTGLTAPSYIVEFKIPAYTEGAADMTKAVDGEGNPLTGEDLENFKKTGRLYGVDPSVNNIANYAFTSGEKLKAGNYIRLNIQIDDLKFSVDKLKDYLDTPTLEEARLLEPDLEKLPSSITKLYKLDEVTNKLVGVSYAGNFTASGSTQREVSKYLWFSLGDDDTAPVTKVAGYEPNLVDRRTPKMVDAEGNPYVRDNGTT